MVPACLELVIKVLGSVKIAGMLNGQFLNFLFICLQLQWGFVATCAFSSCSVPLIVVASVIAEHGLSSTQAQQLRGTGLVATQHVESSCTRDRTHVLCIGTWLLNYCTTREVLKWSIFKVFHR